MVKIHAIKILGKAEAPKCINIPYGGNKTAKNLAIVVGGILNVSLLHFVRNSLKN